MEQDIDDLIIFAVADVVLDKLKEASHLFPGNCLPGFAVIDKNIGQHKTERVFNQYVIIYCQLKSRAKNSSYRFYCT